MVVLFMEGIAMTKRLTISLADEVYENLEKQAKKAGLSKSALLTIFINNNKNQLERK